MTTLPPSPDMHIIGADAELQAKLRQQVNAARQENAQQQASAAFRGAVKNRRAAVRYELTNPAVCYPIAASNEVDRSASLTAIVTDVSATGIHLVMESADPYVGLELIIGVEDAGGTYRFCSGAVVSSKRNGQGLTDVHVRLGGYIHEILENDVIIPILDRTQMRFHLPFPDRTLASLCNIGAVGAEKLDMVIVCPRCQAIPTIREGCSLCLSSHVTSSRMIHHFSCANVDFVAEFETEDGVCCKKCRTKGIIVGSDFEYLDGPSVCDDCGKSNLTTIQIGHCLNCEHRFPTESAIRLAITGYRVNRLDTLALIDPN